ncbi:competence/damage-inducible protein A [Geobacillus subterraneus]|uniref:Putative competence-damage inducible protein n=2 Tax=Geobacillus TaxID=129337 RepID=A0ABM6ACG2_9BACL|nr:MULTISPECIES: competence/damage-inducible protein A [Geobacillus]AMX83970.1 competence/damage-inducible protein A [Geobacillus subterraneus]KZS26761.1 competence/damage-inducible protein A [Geobacillus subterraneus]OXB88174.1 competence/damage-inducible protein A [Geobacillus uzenensis]QIZ67396.1 competence/damage-inducible protein A [Geobacillus subterraneus]WPZ19584.1 competence/damage-inducible protein A [Geobacillus subterraneus]
MNAEIIAVGSELLLGQIANTNAQFLSQQLAELGINVYFHTAVGDNAARLEQAVNVAQTRADLILFTGGLGPTKDDLTKETIARLLGRRLVTDEEALRAIEAYFVRTNRPMTENNKKQALVLEGSAVLKNEHGMAPGMALSVNGITYMLLPGPPKEMRPMFTKYGRAFLRSAFSLSERIESRVLRFFGIGESALETALADLIDAQSNPTIAPLAGDGEVTLRLTAKHRDGAEAKRLLDETEAAILMRVGRYCYGYNDETLFTKTIERLKERGWTVAAAESLTGGWFLEQLTAIAGASAVVQGGVVCYTNGVKEQVLGVPQPLLETDGAVSEPCARLLAENVRAMCGADVGISFTGVAGPDPLEGHPPGTVYVGIAVRGRDTAVHRLTLSGTRDDIRVRTAKYGCFFLLETLAAGG